MIRFDKWLAPLMVHRDEITPDPLNDNNGDVDELVTSIEVNGCYRPIYANAETHLITAGHTLYEALLSMGATYVPVGWGDVDGDTHERRLVGDNQIARLARRDNALTIQLLDRVKRTELGLRGTGFTEEDYIRLLVSPAPVGHGGWLPEVREPASLHAITCPECGHQWTR